MLDSGIIRPTKKYIGVGEMRVFLIVADSFGIGETPDANAFGDVGSNTLKACYATGKLKVDELTRLGLFNVDGVDFGEKVVKTRGAYARLGEKSAGKDTTVGHWELAGLISNRPLPVYPHGFPRGIIDKFEAATGRKVICNSPYSGTEVIKDYGVEHIKSGALIVYTSADSVFQIAAHEDVVPIDELYRYCEIARRILIGENSVGRVIARPFVGDSPQNFKRTSNRHDFSLAPHGKTMLDYLKENGKDVIAVGKINDIFAGRGITESISTTCNEDGLNRTVEFLNRDFDGLCFVNLVDFDSVYGHRNDSEGYTAALNYFSARIGEIEAKLRDDDILMITADHGCDPSTPSTDHSREYVPLLIYGKKIKSVNLGTKPTFACVAKTICELFGVENDLVGESLKREVYIDEE